METDTNMPNVPTRVNATENWENANASMDTKERDVGVSLVQTIALVTELVST